MNTFNKSYKLLIKFYFKNKTMFSYIFFFIVTSIFTVLCKIYNETIIKFIKKYPQLYNLVLSMLHFCIKIYTYFQIKYNKFYDRYLKNLIKQKQQYKYVIIDNEKEPEYFFCYEKDLIMFEKTLFESDLQKKQNKNLIIKEFQKDNKIYRLANTPNCGKIPEKFQSSVLGAEINLIKNDTRITIDITEFIHSFLIIINVRLELLKKYYEIISKKDYSEYSVESVVFLDNDCNEKSFNETITYCF